MLTLERLGQRLPYSFERFLEVGFGGHLGRAVMQRGDVGFVCRVDRQDATSHADAAQWRRGGGGAGFVGQRFNACHGDGDVVPEVENVVVVGDKEVGRRSESVQKRAAHQFAEKEGAKCLAVKKFLGVGRPDRTGALKFERPPVAVGHKKAGDESPVVGFQRCQKTDTERAGIDNRAIHRVEVQGAGAAGRGERHLLFVGGWKRALEWFGAVGRPLQFCGW